jgi:thioredoxin 1
MVGGRAARVGMVNARGMGPLTVRKSVGYDAFRFRIVREPHGEGGRLVGHALKVDEAGWEAQVTKSPGLVLVDFWAVWCGPCQMVAPIIEELAVEYAGKVKVMKLNTDENPEIAGRFQVMSIPTILIFKNGQPVERLVGAMPKRKFKEVLDALLVQTSKTA